MADCVTEFLRTGVLGPLRPGMTREEIEKAIGKPQDEGCHQAPDPETHCILLYGDYGSANLQLSLDGTLNGIWLYFKASDDFSSFPDWVVESPIPLRGSMSHEEFTKWADENGLQWEIDPRQHLTDDRQTTIVLSKSRVTLTFGHEPMLYGALLTIDSVDGKPS